MIGKRREVSNGDLCGHLYPAVGWMNKRLSSVIFNKFLIKFIFEVVNDC